MGTSLWAYREASVKRPTGGEQRTSVGPSRAGSSQRMTPAVPVGGPALGGRGREARPRWARISSTTAGSEIVASRRSRAPQRGQASTSSSPPGRPRAEQVAVVDRVLLHRADPESALERGPEREQGSGMLTS